MEHVSAMAEGRSGIVRNAQGLNPDTLHDTAKGAMALIQAAQKRVRMIARVFAETLVKDLVVGIHLMLREYSSEKHAPYSAKTHSGHQDMAAGMTKEKLMKYKAQRGGIGNVTVRRQLEYASWTRDDVRECCRFFLTRCSGWFVTITDHLLARDWEEELAACGLYVFAPIPFLEMGKQPRMSGDGPASWTCWIVVARPKRAEFMSWGSLPGGYVRHGKHTPDRIPGGKPLDLMRALIRDYSRPGDLVCDPCAGGATTLLAAAQTGRRAVGCEVDATTYAKAAKRLRDTPVAVDWLDVAPKGEQGGLW
jgi:hypothetical protein